MYPRTFVLTIRLRRCRRAGVGDVSRDAARGECRSDGQVLAEAEKVAVAQGRELTRKSLEAVLNGQAEEVEKRGARPEPASAGDRANTAGVIRARSSRRRGRELRRCTWYAATVVWGPIRSMSGWSGAVV